MTDKERRDMKTITEMSSEEMETSKKTEMEKEELLELKRVHDSDDSDESGSAEESAENDGTGIRSIIHYFDTNNIITVIMFYNVQRVRLNCLQLKVLSWIFAGTIFIDEFSISENMTLIVHVYMVLTG